MAIKMRLEFFVACSCNINMNKNVGENGHDLNSKFLFDFNNSSRFDIVFVKCYRKYIILYFHEIWFEILFSTAPGNIFSTILKWMFIALVLLLVCQNCTLKLKLNALNINIIHFVHHTIIFLYPILWYILKWNRN